MNNATFLVLGVACVAAVAVGLRLARAGQGAKADPPNVAHADAKEAAQLVAQGNVTVLDLRTPREFAAGRIAGARNIDYYAADFAEKLGKLDKGKSYLLHCASGRRSTSALDQFARLGFKQIIHLDGGFNAWQRAGNPVEKK